MNKNLRLIAYVLAAGVALSGRLLVATGRAAPARVMGWCLLAAVAFLIGLGVVECRRARRYLTRPREKEGVWRAAPTARADDSTAGRLLRRKWGLDYTLAVRAAKKRPRSNRSEPAAAKGEATLDYLIRCKQGRDGGGDAGEPALWDREIDG